MAPKLETVFRSRSQIRRTFSSAPPLSLGCTKSYTEVATTARAWAVVVAQVVAHRTTDIEVPSLIPTGSWAFFSSLSYFSISGGSLIRSPQRGATQLILQLSKNN